MVIMAYAQVLRQFERVAQKCQVFLMLLTEDGFKTRFVRSQYQLYSCFTGIKFQMLTVTVRWRAVGGRRGCATSASQLSIARYPLHILTYPQLCARMLSDIASASRGCLSPGMLRVLTCADVC